MAFYNANTTTTNSGYTVDKVIQFETGSIQSLLLYNAGPDTFYIGAVGDLDPSGLWYDTSGAVTGTSGLTYTNIGFPIVKADTLGMTWQDFAPTCRGTDMVEVYGHCMSGDSAVVHTYGFMKRGY